MSTLVAQTISNGTVSTSSANVIQGSAKAWANFNGTSGSIRASYNVSSVTYNSTGDYTVNFTNAMTDANYSFVGTGMQVANEGTIQPVTTGSYLAGSVRCVFYDTSAYRNPQVVSVAIFR